MDFSIKMFVFIFAALYLLRVAGPCNCKKNDCQSSPRGVTNGISFRLNSASTGTDIYQATNAVRPVPDSVGLTDLRTGISYPLFIALGPGYTIIHSNEYLRPAGVVDSLLFRFGQAIPDTLRVEVGTIRGWRGDECPMIAEPGITKVILRNQVLVETTTDEATFILSR